MNNIENLKQIAECIDKILRTFLSESEQGFSADISQIVEETNDCEVLLHAFGLVSSLLKHERFHIQDLAALVTAVSDGVAVINVICEGTHGLYSFDLAFTDAHHCVTCH